MTGLAGREDLRAGRQSSSGRRHRGRSPATARSASRRRIDVRSLRGHRRTRRQLGEGRRHFVLAEKLAADVFQHARVATFKTTRHDSMPDWLARHRLLTSAQGLRRRITTSRYRCSKAITSPRTPAPASSTPRQVTAARTSTSGPRMRQSSPGAASTRQFPTPSTRTVRSPITRRASPASACSPTTARRATPTTPSSRR